MIFDMRKDKILFIFKRYKHDDNKVSISENLSFLLITLFIIITRFFKSIIKNKSNENVFDVNFSKDVKKRSTSTLRAFRRRLFKSLIF